MSPLPKDSHYSYTVYADPATAQEFDESRFGGQIGQLIATAQEQVLAEFAGELAGVTVLDVGSGTGRAALALAKRGARVTALDSSREMLRVARSHADTAGMRLEFAPGDAHSLPFPANAFDQAVSLRMLMHTPDWRRCLAEMCRVARQRVIFDYPPLVSASTLQMLLRRVARIANPHAETYHVIGTDAVKDVLEQNGFRVARLHRQFVLPIALHKLINSRCFTEASEDALAAAGLLGLLGSPVTVLAERYSNAGDR